MTMNLAEAEATNRVIRHLTGRNAYPTGAQEIPDRDNTIDALVTLANGAFKRLSASYSPAVARLNLTAHWPGTFDRVWLYEKDGAEPTVWASAEAARSDAVTGWPENADLAWRRSRDGSHLQLYVDGAWTLRAIWAEPIRGLLLPPAEARIQDLEEVANCRVCGCTEDDPCEGGCAWVRGGSLEIDLCTACAWTIARDAAKSGLYPPRLRLPALTEADVEKLDLSADSGSFWIPAPATQTTLEWRAAANAFTDTIEMSFAGDGSEHAARAFIADQHRLFPEDPNGWRLQRREVGEWTDAPDPSPEPPSFLSAPGASSAEAFGAATRPQADAFAGNVDRARAAIAPLLAAVNARIAAMIEAGASHVSWAAPTAPTWTADDGTVYDLEATLVDRFDTRWACEGWLATLEFGRAVPLMSGDMGDHVEYLPIANVLANYGPLTHEAPGAQPGLLAAGPDCCCRDGAMCAACGTGRHGQCPENPEREHLDEDDQDDADTEPGDRER